ncbi:MAG: MarR family winged helix-turn-helix transcriptional regulator [Bacillota bacterium]|nr:MarR family winged helix-turn-helix transcriptional regulator [Bacillota bacterium]
MFTKQKMNFCGEFISIINKNLHKYLKYKLKDIKIKKEEAHFLHYICKNKDIEQNKLTKHFHINKSTTTRKVKKLIANGYIERKKDINDNRKYILSATKSGEELSNKIIRIFNEWNFEITKDLTYKESEQFKLLTNKIINISDNLIKEIKTDE